MKKIITLLLVFFVAICLNACKKPKTIILFNHNPITKDNILHNANQFIAGKKIYYIFMTEKPLETDFIRVRVIKKDGKPNLVPVKLIYSNDFKLKKDQIYYYNNYIVMNEPGDFCMVIYATNALNKPLAIADFRVKN